MDYTHWQWANRLPPQKSGYCETFEGFEPLQLLSVDGDLVLRSGNILEHWNPATGWVDIAPADFGDIAVFKGVFYRTWKTLLSSEGPECFEVAHSEKLIDGAWRSLNLGFGGPPMASGSARSVVATASHLFLISPYGEIASSVDGQNWSEPPGWAGGATLAVSPDSYLQGDQRTSGSWSVAVVGPCGVISTAEVSDLPYLTIGGGVFFDGQWILLAADYMTEGLLTSVDGVEWNYEEIRYRIADLAATENRLVAVGPDGLVMSTEARTAPEMREAFGHPYLLDNGWTGTLWFGDMWFDAALFPWVYQWNHGWIRVGNRSGDGTWFWDHHLGWLWAWETGAPLMYSLRYRSWLHFHDPLSTPGGERWFYDYGTGEWISF